MAARPDELTARYCASDRANEAEAELTEVQERIGQTQARLDETVRPTRPAPSCRTTPSTPTSRARTTPPCRSRSTAGTRARCRSASATSTPVTGNRTQFHRSVCATEQDVNDRGRPPRENEARPGISSSRSTRPPPRRSRPSTSSSSPEPDRRRDRPPHRGAAGRRGCRPPGRDRHRRRPGRGAGRPDRRPVGRQAAAVTSGGDPTGGTTPSPTLPPLPAAARARVAAAMSMQGVLYRWGGADPSGSDRSGLMWMWAWARRPLAPPQPGGPVLGDPPGCPAPTSQPGDLVFLQRPIHHVGMYIGGGPDCRRPQLARRSRAASAWDPFRLRPPVATRPHHPPRRPAPHLCHRADRPGLSHRSTGGTPNRHPATRYTPRRASPGSPNEGSDVQHRLEVGAEVAGYRIPRGHRIRGSPTSTWVRTCGLPCGARSPLRILRSEAGRRPSFREPLPAGVAAGGAARYPPPNNIVPVARRRRVRRPPVHRDALASAAPI